MNKVLLENRIFEFKSAYHLHCKFHTEIPINDGIEFDDFYKHNNKILTLGYFHNILIKFFEKYGFDAKEKIEIIVSVIKDFETIKGAYSNAKEYYNNHDIPTRTARDFNLTNYELDTILDYLNESILELKKEISIQLIQTHSEKSEKTKPIEILKEEDFKNLEITINKDSRNLLVKEYSKPTVAKMEIIEENNWLVYQRNKEIESFNENLKSITDEESKVVLIKEFNAKELEILDKMLLNDKEAIDWEINNLKCFLSDYFKIVIEELYLVVKENKDLPELLKFLLQRKNHLNLYKFNQSKRGIGSHTKIQFDPEQIEEYETILDEQIQYVREILNLSKKNDLKGVSKIASGDKLTAATEIITNDKEGFRKNKVRVIKNSPQYYKVDIKNLDVKSGLAELIAQGLISDMTKLNQLNKLFFGGKANSKIEWHSTTGTIGSFKLLIQSISEKSQYSNPFYSTALKYFTKVGLNETTIINNKPSKADKNKIAAVIKALFHTTTSTVK